MKEEKPSYEDLLAKINIQEQKMNKVKRLYLFISKINQIIVRAQDKNQLFKDVCNIAVEIGGYEMAWIGITDRNNLEVIPVVIDDRNEDYLLKIKNISISSEEKVKEQDPVKIAISKGSYYVCNSLETNSETELWKTASLNKKCHSLMVIPIKVFEEIIGVYMIYGAENNYFDEEEVNLLNNATTDVNFALENFEKEAMRKQAEEAVAQSEKRFHTLTDVSPVGIFRTDLTGATTYVNQRWTQIVGISFDQSMGSGWYIAIHPDDRIKIYNEWKNVVSNKRRSLLEYRFIKPDGNIVWVIGEATPETNSENEIVGFIGTITDITQRKQAEEKFVKTSKKMEAIIEAIPDMMFEIDLKGTIFNYHSPSNNLLLMPPEQFIGKTIFEVMPENAATICLSALKEANEKGYSRGKQYALEINNGKCWFELSLAPMKEDETSDKHFIVVSRDITEQKIANEAMLKNKERYRGVLDNLEAGIVAHDANGAIIMCNNKSAELLGYSIDELMAEDRESLKWNFLNEDYTKMQIEDYPISQIFKSKKVIKNFPLGIIEPLNQSVIWFLVNGFPIFDEEGNIQEVVTSFIDVTEQKRMNYEIQRAKELAERANKSKTDFLANMSHEIRTPLNGIIGFTSLLMESNLERSQKVYMQTINESATILMDIVNDILDFSKIEAGKLELKMEETDFCSLINQAVSLFKYQANQKHIELESIIDPQVPKFIYTDSLRLKQIIINLLGNAVKFTQKGKVQLEIKVLHPLEDSFVNLSFSVKDTGIGIQPENLDKIFHSFEQEDNSTSRQFGGTGLGLAISNRLLALMNSNLELESKYGEGSNFHFTIKLRKVEEQSQYLEKKKEQLLSMHISGVKKVLIVEDNAINMLLAKTLVKKIIPESIIIEAFDGDQAIKQYQIEKPDIILMDIQMPNKNGFEATYEIRKIEQQLATPIIALTAGIFVEEKEECVKAGMNDYITKPIIISDLEIMLNKWLIK